LNANHFLSLPEGGQTYGGTFVATGSTPKLGISGGAETAGAIQGSNLTDGRGQTSVPQEHTSPAPRGRSPGPGCYQNGKSRSGRCLDLIAKIGASKCRFDTSTDALIQSKQSGVSAAVVKAMVSAARRPRPLAAAGDPRLPPARGRQPTFPGAVTPGFDQAGAPGRRS
jgi:hypothetical protein